MLYVIPLPAFWQVPRVLNHIPFRDKLLVVEYFLRLIFWNKACGSGCRPFLKTTEGTENP
jgi:hypothetical protein